MAPYAKPETSLKRAEELLSLTPPKEKEALDALAEVFISKRFKATPVTALEPVIIRFLELCVTMRKAKIAKDGLGAYRNVAQSSNVPSIELVIKKFLAAATAKVVAAQASAAELLSTEAATPAGDEEEVDLDAPLEPSTLLLMSVDAQRDRTDRQVVLPALRFLWECLRVCLEVLRNSARLEIIYQQIVHQAFQFCVLHARKTEFRRLCEIIRKDLATVNKYAHQPNTINLSDPDVLARHLETRFQQLNSAVDLELWQEAFRSVEDIQGLLSNPASKKAQKPAMMANYYEKLTRVFKAEGGSMAVFHAAAWGRYMMYVEKGKDGEEMEKLAGFVLLSALAVPVMEDGEGKKNAGKLVTLLNLPKMPTRAGLLKEALDRNILSRVSPTLRSLYTLLEVDFHPLSICSSTSPIIASLLASPDYSQYASPIRHVVLSRLFQQLSQVYDAVSVDHVLSLVEPFQIGKEQLEKFVMAACKRSELAVRVDHVGNSIVFLDEPFASGSGTSSVAGPSSSSLSEVVAVGNLQPPTADLVRTQLTRLASLLHSTVQYIDPSIALAAKESQRSLFAQAVSQGEADQRASSARRAIVARRKELTEELNARRATEEAVAKAERTRIAAETAKKREEEDFKKRAREKIQKEIDQVRIDEARKLAESLKQKGGLKVDADKIDNMDTDGLVQLQVEQLEKEKKELAERLRIVSKRVDHVERAFRKEERPLVLADYERQQADDLVAHQLLVKQTRDEAKEKHDSDVLLKNRLARMLPDYQKIKKDIHERQADSFEKTRKEAEIKIKEAKEKLRKEVFAARAERRRLEEEELKREEEEAAEREIADAQRRDDELRQTEEDAKRKEIEARNAEAEEKAAAARRAEREKAKAEDAEKSRLQQAREEEAFARRANKSSAPAGGADSGSAWSRTKDAAASVASDVAAKLAPTAVKPGGWRDRVASAIPGVPSPSSSSSAPVDAKSPSPRSPAPLARSPAGPSSDSPLPSAGGGGYRPGLKLAPRSTPAPTLGPVVPTTTSTPSSPAPAPAAPALAASSTPPATNGALKAEDEGFTAVPERGAKYVRGAGKWGRGQSRA